METNENEGKKGMWNSTAVNNGSSVQLQKTDTRIDIYVFNQTSSTNIYFYSTKQGNGWHHVYFVNIKLGIRYFLQSKHITYLK